MSTSDNNQSVAQMQLHDVTPVCVRDACVQAAGGRQQAAASAAAQSAAAGARSRSSKQQRLLQQQQATCRNSLSSGGRVWQINENTKTAGNFMKF